ncbi:MAG TPA: AfsA-related hotdog domain-containing protein [Cellvibrionaceae bacterium]|nr:AfsA-related hotdog domain-containing protein [Cellvibrionaceae bacterium]HMW73077.1 AfsA-related hotdog domain-containing protein [Cellvibrionaceae bacterium]HMY40700.1 AfsA-related hotdog domain-containing protein [Marinagarivorans sp.]HNG60984.1 AfsA-related hotdog domain-containing protein [Cellvibrionaceae bacterium]
MDQYELMTKALTPLSNLATFEEEPPSPTTPPSGLVFYVVGDRFERFCDHNVVLNYAEALEQHKIIARLASEIVIGQGIGAQQLQALQTAFATADYRHSIVMTQRLSEKVPAALVDKRDAKNVLVTRPTQNGPLYFRSQLVVDDHCVEFADCTDGEHLPGTLLIEAAKQLFIASIRTHKPAPLNGTALDEMRFTLTGIQVQFEHFVFPIAAELHLTLQDIEITNLRAKGTAIITIEQLGRRCCQIIFHAHAYSETVAESLEHRCGLKIKNRLLAANL